MSRNNYLKYSYLLTIFFITLSGFGQMPIFKRYYIADIPGFGWLAKFFVTHYIHYVCAALLLGLAAYITTDYIISERKSRKLSATGYLRGALIAGLIATGIPLVIRNFEGVMFPHNFIIFLDLSHLTLVMLFLILSLYCVVSKKKWTKAKEQSPVNSR